MHCLRMCHVLFKDVCVCRCERCVIKDAMPSVSRMCDALFKEV